MVVGNKENEMKRFIKHTAALTASLLALVACDEQRDLYSVAKPMLQIEGNWAPSLDREDMSQDATALIYGHGNGVAGKEYFYAPRTATVRLQTGLYDVVIFNGLMYSGEDTHLDGVFFRGTDHLDTFEGCAREEAPSRRLARAEGEIIATNDMEILTSAWAQEQFEGEDSYYLKYRNGKNGFPVTPDYIESSLHLTPFAVSYTTRVIVHLVHPNSALIANGAFRGFAGSVFMASRMPSHVTVTHQLKLNHKQYDDATQKTGTIRSDDFVTFGPPLDLPSRKYEFELSIILVNGATFHQVYDVTSQIAPVIERIKANQGKSAPVETGIEIVITISAELPDVEVDPGAIGVIGWEDDEIIRVPIRN